MTEAMLAHVEGRLDEAAERYSASAAALLRVGANNVDGIVALGVVTVRHTQGRLVELLPMLENLAAEYPDSIADTLAIALVESGRVAEAHAAVTARGPIRHDFLELIFRTLRGRAAVALEDREEAAVTYAALLPFAGRVAGIGTGSYALCPVAQVLGDLAALLGRPEDAAGHYRTAVEVALTCGSLPWRRTAEASLDRLQVGDAAAPSRPQADH
jgi:hypothetical protein